MANEMRDRLIDLLYDMQDARIDTIADHLIENGVIVPQWISVNDRLPEKNGKCLCANYSKTFSRYFIEVLSFAKDLHQVDEFEFKNEKGKSGFYDYAGEWGYTEYESVTHWMPLPEPPQAEQKLKEMRGE